MAERFGTGLLLALLLALLPFPVTPQASPVVEITDRHPGAGQVLAVDEPLYLRVAYRSETPVRFQLRASGDAGLSATMNPAPVHPAGTGEALVSLAQRKSRYLETGTLLVFDEHWRELEAIQVSLQVRWGVDGAASTEPHWVTTLRREQQERLSAAAETNRNAGGGRWLVQLMALSIPAYLILQIVAWCRWRNGWRTAGLLPLWVAVPLFAYTVGLLIAGSSLWPAMLLLLTPFLLVYLAALFIARRIGARDHR
ncbi:MAG: hypothetical protein JJT90_15915 [Ectothiorhodospiraceae bacterium]|nr:hypothetical protein [Ectothiorhodospiraceae bacterium]